MKINEVPKLWKEGRPAKVAKTFKTDGQDLYSYKLKIGYTNEFNQKVLITYTAQHNAFKSHTTSRHVNLAAYYADIFESPTTGK